MASLRAYAYSLGLILLLVGLILIPLYGVFVAAPIIGIGGALILFMYFYGWMRRHPLFSVVAVAVLLILLYALLPLLVPSLGGTRLTTTTTQAYPTAASATGTNCAATDLGAWNNRDQAFQDNVPNSDATSASAIGDPAGAACDDWSGFGYAGLNSTLPIISVKVTIEYSVSAGRAQLRVAPFSGTTKCTGQSTSLLTGPTAYLTDTFDFTSCGNWTTAKASALGVTVEAVPQIQSTVFMDYVRVTIVQEGNVSTPPPAGTPIISDQVRANLTYALGLIALAAGIAAFVMWLFRMRSTKWFKMSAIIAIFAGLGWFLLSYVIR